MNKKTAMWLGAGIVLGVVLAPRLRQLPVIKSLPTL